jgi:hypothetical protein
MIRVIFLFLVLAILVFGFIKVAEKLTGKQLKKLTQIASYVIISATVAIGLMFALVVFF